MSGKTLELVTGSAEETIAAGKVLGDWLREGDVVLLHGDLGAGKTTLTKGIAAQLRVNDVVSSPSFALVNEYEAGLAAPVERLYHLDLYRLQESAELATIGFADLVAPDDGIAVVEWPERASDHLPARYVLVEMEHAGPDRRTMRISAEPGDERWAIRLADLCRRLAERTG